MADTKTSAEASASALDGTELVRAVQSGGNVKITGTQIKTLCVGAGSVSIASGKTLTTSNTLTFTGTDSSSVAFGAGGTVLYSHQTITLSGDASGSGTTSISVTIANSAVTTAKINSGAVTEAKLTLADNTTGNVSTSAHGFAPKAPNDATKYLDGTSAYSVPAGTVPRSHIAGLTLSNDGGTPNSVLDVAAGMAADSTNAVLISIGAFTKSTAGSWTSGTGNNGMGNGLTIANSTWYHVILANNGGTPDIYFDTSASGANRPSGISDTKARRIGSFLTDGSAHIVLFTQVGDTFYWGAEVRDINNSTADLSAGVLFVLSTPLGVQTRPLTRLFSNNAANIDTLVTSPSGPNGSPSHTSAPGFDINGFTVLDMMYTFAKGIYTDTSSQIRIRNSSAGSIQLYGFTAGWVDDRGRYN